MSAQTVAAASTRPAKPPMSTLRIVLVLGALEAFGPLSMDLYMPQLPQLAAAVGTSDALAQATMSVCMIGLGLGQLIAGPLSDRFGRKRPLVVGVMLFTLLSAACAFAPSIELLLVARFLQGLAGSAGVVISLAIARDLFEGVALSRMLSLLAVVSAAAPIIAPIIGGQLARVMDWRGVFLVLTGIGALLIPIAWLGMRETLTEGRHTRAAGGRTSSHVRAVLRDPLFLSLMTASALGGAAFFSYLSMSSFVLQGEFSFTPQMFSIIFAVNALANLGGAQISRVLVLRLGVVRMYLTGQIVGAAMTVALLVCALIHVSAPVFVVLLALYLGAVGLGGPNGSTLALSHHAERAGTASAMLGVSMFVVGAVSAPLVSAAFGTSAVTLAASVAVFSVLAALIGIFAVRRYAAARV